MKKIVLLLVFCLAAAISGCGKAPDQVYGKNPTATQGGKTQMTGSATDASGNPSKEGEATSSNGDGFVKLSELLAKTPKTLNTEMAGKRDTLKIENATVNLPAELHSISTYKSTPYYMDKDLLLRTAFADHAGQAIIDPDNGTQQYQENGKKYIRETYIYAGQSASRNELLGSFNFQFVVDPNYDIRDESDENIEQSGTAKCKITQADAIKEAKDFFDKLKIDTKVMRMTAFGAAKGSAPFYSLFLSPAIDGLPILYWTPQNSGSSYWPAYIDIVVCDKGIGWLDATTRNHTAMKTDIDSVISLDKALEILKENVDTLPTNLNEPVNTVYLGYVEKPVDNDTVETIPVWAFSSGINQSTNVHTNVFVDALTGDILR